MNLSFNLWLRSLPGFGPAGPPAPTTPIGSRLRRAALTGAGLFVLGLACPAHAESLADAVALAYQTNPALLASRADLRAMDERYLEARAAMGPTVSVNGQETIEDARVTQQGLFSSALTTSGQRASYPTASFSLNQPLYYGGQLNAALSVAQADLLAGRQSLRQQEALVLAEVITAYADVLMAQAMVVIAEQDMDILRLQSNETLAKFKVKEVTLTDRAQTRARQIAAQIRLQQARNSQLDSQARYLAVVGERPGKLDPLPDLPGMPASVDEAFDIALQANPTLLGAQFTERAAYARIAEAKSADGLRVGVQATASREPLVPYLPAQHVDAYTAALVVSKSLFTSGAHNARVREARADDDRDALRAADSQRQVISQVARGWNDLVARRKVLTALRDQLKEEQSAFEGSQIEERNGLRTTIDVLNAEQEFQTTKISLAQGYHDEYVTRANFMTALGLLRVELISPGAQIYRPEKALRDRLANPLMAWTAVVGAIDAVGAPSPRARRPARDLQGADRPAVPEAPSAAPLWSDLTAMLATSPTPPAKP